MSAIAIRYEASPGAQAVAAHAQGSRSQAFGMRTVGAASLGHCAACAMRAVCLPTQSSAEAVREFAGWVARQRRVPAGSHIYRAGERASAVYAVRSGFVKIAVTTDDGREQVIEFSMMGDFIGIDGAGRGVHMSDAVALEATTLCEVPVGPDALLAPGLGGVIHSVMSREIDRQRSLLLLLGTLHAEERLAWFLIDLGERYRARGFSASQFVLRMSRADLGSYLGLRLETVSRLLSKLHKEGILRVSNKSVEILDLDAIRTLKGESGPAVSASKTESQPCLGARDGLHH